MERLPCEREHDELAPGRDMRATCAAPELMRLCGTVPGRADPISLLGRLRETRLGSFHIQKEDVILKVGICIW